MNIVDIEPYGMLPKKTAKSYRRMRAFFATLGFDLKPTGPYDALRPVNVQEKIFRERYTTTYLAGRPYKVWNGRRWYQKPGTAMAAVPGTSNHGKGLAVDFTGLGGVGGEGYKLLAKYGGQFGWNNREGRSINEPWHWCYDASNDEQAVKAGVYRIVKGAGRKPYARLFSQPKLGKKYRARRRKIGKNVRVMCVVGRWALTKKGDWIRVSKLRKVK